MRPLLADDPIVLKHNNIRFKPDFCTHNVKTELCIALQLMLLTAC
uniref:Uncharacterized protein n=1 Tax=Anguilla anguilla TaxID=7936 RepID=A0A0E9SMN7_ANGAN